MISPSHNPTLSHLPLPSISDENFVHVISGLLSTSECTSLIQIHSQTLLESSTSFTIRGRHMFDDSELTEMLWERLKPFYGDMRIVDEEGSAWVAKGLNERIRFCKYEKGGLFVPHFDGRRLAAVDSQTFLTVNIYLNTVPLSQGGATRILSPPPDKKHVFINTKANLDVIAAYQPVQGTATVFRDSLWHDGQELYGDGSEKYLMRTDVMFAREKPLDFAGECQKRSLSEKESGSWALEIAARLEDGGAADEARGWYKRAFRLWPPLERGE